MANARKQARQRRAAIRLHDSLSTGEKNTKNEKGETVVVPLSDGDRQRISNEMNMLGQYMQGLRKQ